ncbi:Morphine 6-dehydrogenase [compost metagenome]
MIADAATAHGKTPAQVILRWHRQSGVVAIPKSTNPAHIAQNLDIEDFALTDAEMARIDGLARSRPLFRAPRAAVSVAARLMRPRQLR